MRESGVEANRCGKSAEFAHATYVNRGCRAGLSGSPKIDVMTNRSRPTQAKRIREKALQEKRQQKASRRQDAKDRRDQRDPGAPEGEDPDIAGIVPGPQPHPYLDPDEEL